MTDGGMVFKFRDDLRVPPGATADGVVAEREKIEERCGSATVDKSAREVLRVPDEYPNLHAFCPKTAEEAMLIATRDGIRKAYKSVVIERIQGTGPPTQIRWLHAPRGEGGDREYKTLQQIREDPKDLKKLVADLRAEAGSYAQKMRNVLAEVEEAL